MAPFGGFCVVMILFAVAVLAAGEVAALLAPGGFIDDVLAATFAGLLAAVFDIEFDIELVVFDIVFDAVFDIMFVEFDVFAAVFVLFVFEVLVAAPPQAIANANEDIRVSESRILVFILIISLAIRHLFLWSPEIRSIGSIHDITFLLQIDVNPADGEHKRNLGINSVDGS